MSEHPPMRLSELAVRAGVSRHKLYEDIERGELVAFRVRCGRLRYWYVDRAEGERYLSVIQERLAS